MRKLLTLCISACILLLPSCDPYSETRGNFKLLPEPEIVEFYGNSELYPDSIEFYRLADGVNLPVPEEFVEGLEETNKISGPQIVFLEDI